tara:strand:+ start:88 stop:954 length:867 start_codon:yes stop_codon:yes gene_type:complete
MKRKAEEVEADDAPKTKQVRFSESTDVHTIPARKGKAKEVADSNLKELLDEDRSIDPTQIDEEDHIDDDDLRRGDDIAIEPFNLKHEMEVGYFDEGGHYVERRRFGNSGEDDNIADPWYDDVMNNVHERGEGYFAQTGLKGSGYKAKRSSSSAEMEDVEFDMKLVKQKIIDMLQEGETVTKAMRRLAPEKKERGNIRRKAGNTATKDKQALVETELDKLTALADSALGNGYYSVYNETREAMVDGLDIKWEYLTGTGDEKVWQPNSPSRERSVLPFFILIFLRYNLSF